MPRDILIDPQRAGSGNPNIQFSGSAGNPLRLEVLSEGSVQFTGVSGSLFKISDFPVAGGGLNSLFLSGTTAITGSFLPGVTDLYDLGSSTKRWANIFATSISGSLTGSNVLAGQVVVAGTGGVLSGSNVFWWDNTNKRVGIGTSSGLTTLLYLTGSSSDGITIRTDTAPRVSYQRSSDGQGWSEGYDIVNNGFVISQSPTSLTTTQRLFINSGGYVGVGTVTPLARFYITGSSTASDTTFLVREGVASPVGSANILNVQNSAGTSILMVSGSGKVGIGAAPAYSSPLYVFGNNSFPQITAAGSSGISPNGTSGYNLKIDSTDLWQLITDNNASNFFFLQYNNTSLGRYLSVSTTGNVGIGTTIPNSNSGYTTLTLASSTTGGRTDYNQSSTAVGSIYNDSSALYVQGNASKILVLGTNASEKVRIDTSGNVGIGTATPAALLTVSGTIVTKYSTGLESYIAAGTYSAGAAGFYPIYNTQSATGGLFGGNDTVIKYAAAGNNFVLLHGTTVVMTANSSESVGIGSTTSISARFQVSGSSTSSTPTMIVREGVVSPTAGVGVFDVQNSAGTSILFVTGSQRVGIGTTAPQAAFHVVNGSVPNAANLYIGYVGSNNYYDANQHYYRDGSGNTRLTISSGGNVAPGSDNTQDLGSTALRWRNVYAASVSGSLTGSNVLAGQVVVAGTGGVLSGSSNFWWDNSNSRVGIGTSSPLGKLSVGSGNQSVVLDSTGTGGLATIQSYNGALKINDLGNNTILNTGGGTVGIGTTNPPASKLFVSGSATLTDPVLIVKGGVVSPTGGAGVLDVQNSVGTSLLFVSGSGNVGIGSSAPAVKLDVAGAIRGTTFASDRLGINTNPLNTVSTAQSQLRFQNTGGDFYAGIESSVAGAFFPGSAAYSAVLYNAAATPLHLYTNATLRVTIDSSGNVGIGTTIPATKLSVYSGAVSANYGVFSGSLSSYASATGALYTYWNTSSNYGTIASAADNSGNAAPMQLRVGGTLSTHIDSSGNVGIGTTSPFGAKLAIYGGTLPSGGSGASNLSFATNLSTGRLASGGGGSDVSIINTFFDSSTVELSAGTTSGYVAGIGVGARSSPANDSVTIYTRSVEKIRVYGASSLMSVTASIEPGTDNTYDLGSSTKRWRSLYAVSVSGSLTGSNVLAGQVVVAGTGGALSGTNNFTYDNSTGNLTISGSLRSVYSVGDEGGEIFFAKPQTNTSINTGVTIDMYQNKIRIFETGGTNRGGYFDITSLGAAASTNLAGSGGATSTNYWFESAINTIYSTGSVGVGTNSYAARFFVSGSSTASTPTMIVREGVSSPTSGVGILNVQNSAGTSILFVTGSGNVGIGNTTPSYAMDVVGQVKTRLQTSGNATGIIIGNNGSEQPHIQFTASDNSARFKMQVNSVNAASERLSFYAGPLGGTATNEAMIIGGNGNVGIGTGTLATSRLLVTGSGATSSTSTMHLVNSSNSSLLFVRDDGNVGIGSSSPGYTLQIGSGASVGTRTLALIDSGYGIVIKGGNGNGIVQSLGTTVPLELQAGNGNNGNYYFTSTGNVGIGTAAASSKLFVYTTQNDATATPSVDINAAFARIGDATTGLTFNNGVGIKFHDAGTVHYSIGQLSGNFYMSQTSDNGNVLFSPARTDVIVFNSSGNVGIGSTTPGYKLDVNGDINLASTKILRVNGTAVVNTQGSNGSDIYMNARVVRNESSVNTDGLYLGYGNSGTTTGHIRFFANGTTERMKIAADTGSVIISDLAGSVSTSAARLLVSGSSTSTTPTMVVKEGITASSTAVGVLDTQSYTGSSLFFVSGSGFVGVGTSMPSSPDVITAGGKFQVSSSNVGNSSFGLIVGAQFLGISLNYYDANTHIFRHSDGSTRRMLITGAGNVGIGGMATVGSGYSPLGRLVVTGSNDSSTAGMVVKSGLPSPVASVLDIQNNDGTTLFFVSGSGNVGIGTNVSNGNKLSVSGETAITGSVTPGVDNTYSLGSSGKRWKTIYVATGSISNVVFSPVSTGATYVTTFASGESGRLTATKTINSSTNTTFFTVAENNGASMFDVSFVVSESGFSVARKYSVASQHGTSSTNVVSFKTVDTGPYSGNDLTVTFSKTSATVTTCTVSQNSGGAVNIAMTIDISAISSGGAPTTVTIF